MQDQLEVRRVGVDGVPQGEPVVPDTASVWPIVTTIETVWLEPDDQTLVVVGLRTPSTVLRSLDVEEAPTHVGLLAHHGYPLEIARWMVESSEQPGEPLVGLMWRVAVRLQSPLGGRPVIDRGPQVLRSRGVERGETLSDQALVRLHLELAAAETPAARRRIRQTIKAIRRNPFKAMPLPDVDGAEPEGPSR